MKRFVLLLLLLIVPAGCSTLKEMPSGLMHRYDAGCKLSTARQEMEQGKPATAVTILENLVDEPGVSGVTDEALFRLSLLKLSSEEKDGSLSSIHYLERLRSEYRESSWAQQAKPLLDLLKSYAEMKRHNRTLFRDNKELKQNIERLKSLDLQLERKPR